MTADPQANVPLLHLDQVRKSLGGRCVLVNVNLSVSPGELVVLLGPNGAGKTTLLGTACGRISPDTGSVELCGGNPRKDAGVRQRLGFVPQDIALYPYLSVRENLQVFGRLMGVSKTHLTGRVASALDWSGLADRADKRVDTLSGGMRRRLNIVASLLHEPRMLMLDEPTVGVDVNARERIHELLRLLRAQGLGVLLTTHDLEQATSLADRVVFLLAGEVRLEGAPRELIEDVYEGGKELLVTFLQAAAGDQVKNLKRHGLLPAHGELTWSGTVKGDYQDLAHWSRLFADQKLEVAELRVRDPNLESVFLRLTGEELKL